MVYASVASSVPRVCFIRFEDERNLNLVGFPVSMSFFFREDRLYLLVAKLTAFVFSLGHFFDSIKGPLLAPFLEV